MVWEGVKSVGGGDLTGKTHLSERKRLANGNPLNFFQKKKLKNRKPIRQFQNTNFHIRARIIIETVNIFVQYSKTRS